MTHASGFRGVSESRLELRLRILPNSRWQKTANADAYRRVHTGVSGNRCRMSLSREDVLVRLSDSFIHEGSQTLCVRTMARYSEHSVFEPVWKQ